MKYKILFVYFILFSIILNLVFSNENNKPEQQAVDEDNNLLMKNIEEDNVNDDYLKINFEDKIRNTVDKIMNTANNNDNELSTLFGYLFGYNLNEQGGLQEQVKQSKMDQLKDYFESFNDIISAHKFTIDYVRVQKLVHEISRSSSIVYKLDENETKQLERNLYRLANYLLKRVLNSFGIQEESKKDKSENIINDHLFVENAAEKQEQEEMDSATMNKEIKVINSVSEVHIKELAHHIVVLANSNPEYSSTLLSLLDVEKKTLSDQENSVSSFIKVALSFIRSLLVLFATVNEEVTEGDILHRSNKVNMNLPEWLSESTIKDIQSLASKEILNPRTIIAFNKLFVRDSRPLEKYEKESLTNQLIDLAYSVLYGKNSEYQIDTNEGIATVNNNNQQQQEKLIQKSINQEIVNRIINLAYETDEKAKSANFEGFFYRSIRLFFSLFHIDDYFDQNQQDEIQENQLNKPNIELVPEEYNDKQEKNLDNDDTNAAADTHYEYDMGSHFKDYNDDGGAGKIQYIAQRVNKLIDSDKEAKDDDIKRAENVFRILYKLYLYYYGYQDDNQLEQPKSNKVVEDLNNEKVKRENEELKFIQEIIPMLNEQDLSNVLLELDRAATQLGYKSRNIDDQQQEDNYNELEKKERDLSHFEYN